MLPTTYRGEAIIDGERVSGVLHLSSDSVRLALENNQEILRWPIGSLEVDTPGKGAYELSHGSESFMFEPAVDDGLEDEISLRRRFFAPPVEYTTPDPPGQPAAPAEPETSPPPTPPSESIAERVAAAGRHSNGDSLLGAGDRFRRYLLVGSLGLTVVIVLAIAATVITSDDPTTVAAEETPVTTLATPPTTSPPPASTAEPVPTTAAPPTTSPPAVAGATVTTTPPTTTTTTLPPAGSVFEIGPAVLAERWDVAVGSHSSALTSDNLEENGGEFAFDAGPFVRLQGSTQDGTVSRIAFLGDPSGTVEDDREVLTGLGMALSLVEPRLPPEGRRELLLALGLDVEDPDLGGLDNSLDYRGHTYWLRWDGDLERLVLDVRPNDDQTQDELAANEDDDS